MIPSRCEGITVRLELIYKYSRVILWSQNIYTIHNTLNVMLRNVLKYISSLVLNTGCGKCDKGLTISEGLY